MAMGAHIFGTDCWCPFFIASSRGPVPLQGTPFWRRGVVRQRGRGRWGGGGGAYVSAQVGERLDCHCRVHQKRPPCTSFDDAVRKAGRMAAPASLSD